MAIKIAGTEVINDNRELVLAKLTEINATIADTAVDVFVYDTRKDSDGGAWRKRTQHTSWYNETLNTATRGSRKEFPAVAVIVAESDQVTIYDGDDPDIPMWMVFNSVSDGYINVLSSAVSSITALNGKVVAGASTNASWEWNFISDNGQVRNATALYDMLGPIEGRDDGNGYSQVATSGAIVSSSVNDVAMTVLPNAPIDPATGLPVPTIAVATVGGTSVITDSGAVYDVTGFQPVENVNFSGSKLAINTPVGSTSYVNIGAANLSADVANIDWREVDLSSSTSFDLKILPNQASHQAFDDTYYSAGSVGLLSLKPDYAAPETCLHAFTTSSYNTGWMNGDIKLATLSDTDDTNVTGSELVDQTASGWTLPTGYSHDGSGALSYDGTGVRYTKTYDAFTVEAGKLYVLSFNLSAASPENSGLCSVWVNTSTSAPSAGTSYEASRINPDSAGLYTSTFYADTNGGTVYFTVQNNLADATQTFTLEDISIRLAEEDRSVNGNGLQVFGTVTKSAVATGAHLVAYSGFSGSNYLEQPYNNDLDFGTGDFCYMWWANVTGVPAYQTHFAREYYNGSTFTGAAIEVFTETSGGYLRVYLTDDGFSSYDTWNSNGVAYGVGWQHFALVRRGNIISTYINGVLDNNKTLVQALGSLDNSNAKLIVSQQDNGKLPGTSVSIALLRISATAPTPEQIRKIYEDEKVLFQEGAQATLYGSSDAVTALAYDDTTELLHVGTSAGRSVFQGLRRVDNTTNAVGSAISASNGLVAED